MRQATIHNTVAARRKTVSIRLSAQFCIVVILLHTIRSESGMKLFESSVRKARSQREEPPEHGYINEGHPNSMQEAESEGTISTIEDIIDIRLPAMSNGLMQNAASLRPLKTQARCVLMMME